jgi:LPXTG-motif cell wall-anchored protein
MTETALWAGFAALVSCGVVAAGQGPREEAIWILGIGGASLGLLGLGLFGLRRRRHGRA